MSTPGNVQTERYQVFRRAGSTKWQVRFSIKGQGQFKHSLDTDDEREAERRAEAIWYEATYRAKHGLTAKTHSFESVARLLSRRSSVRWNEASAEPTKARASPP